MKNCVSSFRSKLKIYFLKNRDQENMSDISLSHNPFNPDSYNIKAIKSLTLSGSPIYPPDIAKLESLESLKLYSCIGKFSLRDFNKIPLKKLDIKLYDDSIDLMQLAELNLTEFSCKLVKQCNIGLSRIELNLTVLHLENVCTENIFTNLRSPLVSLTLKFCNLKNITGISNFPKLVLLDLSYNYNIELDKELNTLNMLMSLNIYGTCYLSNILYSLNINILQAIKPEIPIKTIDELIETRLSKVKRAI